MMFSRCSTTLSRPGGPSPRMNGNARNALACCIIILVSVCALAESRVAATQHHQHQPQQHKKQHHRSPTRPHGDTQAPVAAHHAQRSAGPSVRPRPVVVFCHPDAMEVVVRADMFDTGLRVDGRHLRLGIPGPAAEDHACGAVPSGEAEFTLRARLVDCGTRLSSTEEKIIYSTVLIYSPEISSEGLQRLDGAKIPVECHYGKKYAVDGISLHPTWVPLVSITSAEDQIDFNLQLMSDNWQFERGSYTYFLGDPLHFEISAVIGNHMPLRVYVDKCVATPTQDAGATIRYDFIEHDGCLTDAYLTNSSSHFLPRVEEHKLRFQLDAFRFYQEPRNQVYITCYVKAVSVTVADSLPNRACSLMEKRWRSVDGNDQACRSCDISRQFVEPPSTEPNTPVISTEAQSAAKENVVLNTPEQHTASYVRFRPGMHQSQRDQPRRSSARQMKRGLDNKTEETMQLGPLIILHSSKFESRPTDSKTGHSPKNKTT